LRLVREDNRSGSCRRQKGKSDLAKFNSKKIASKRNGNMLGIKRIDPISEAMAAEDRSEPALSIS
jgi:hypothetical protein